MNATKFNFTPRRLLSARRLCAVAALCVLAGVARAQDFSISTLTPNNAVVVDVNSLVGDDRGGIAVNGSQVFLTGDAATARFNRDTLGSGASLGVVRDGLVANLATSTVYLLGNASSNALASGGGTFATLIELNGSTGVPSGNVIALSTPITLTGSSASVGIFSGWNRVVVHTGTRVYRVSLPDGAVTDLGAMSTPVRTASESWAYWGVAENVGSDTYIVYVRNSTTISRTKVPSGPTTTVATFVNLNDMASFTVSVAQNRWYFHHESSSQFGAFSESLGYADATFVSAPVAPTIAVQPVGVSIYVGESASFSVSANGTGPLAYQWLKNGSPITDATNTTYAIGVAALADAGSYSLVVTNVSGSVTSSVALLTVSAIDADLFKILRLTGSNVVVTDPLNYAGDDRGGLVATDQKIYLRGDDSVGSFNLSNLGGGIRLGTNFGALTNFFFYDSLVSDLRSQKAYVLGGGGTNILGIFGGTVSNLVELHGSNGVPTGTTITLSSPIVMPGTGLYNANVGLFSGWGRIVLHNGTRAYSINPANGTVTDLGAMTFPTHVNSESWASWGVAEYFGGSHYMVYARDAQSIVRTRIPDGATTVISTFSNLADLANFTVVPGLNRWYFHNESVNQFTNYNNFGAEVLGYADAAFLYQAPQATIVSQPQSLTVTVGASATFSVSATAVAALSYQWKTNGVALAGATGSSVTFANAQLTDSGLVFSVTVMDGGDPVDSANATLTVLPNAAPTLVVPANVTVNEDAGSQTNLVTIISAGAAHESGQTLTVTATSGNPALTGPITVTYAAGAATLRYTNVANAFGSATITVTVTDNGGVTSGGMDSTAVNYLLTVNPVNDAPSATRATNNVVVLEDVGSTGVAGFLSAISVGPGEAQVLSVSVANNNSALFLVPPAINLLTGDLTFTPAPNAFGSATVTYILSDDGGVLNGGVDASTNTFTITVTGVNDAPTLALGVTTVNVLTNAGAFTTNIAPVATVGPASETNSQTIVGYVASNDNNALFSVQPTLGLNGNLNFTVAGNVTGTAVVSVQAQDSGDNLNGGTNRSAVVTVTITVSGPNIFPTFTLATNNLVVAEDSGNSSIIAFLFGLSAGEVTQSVTNLTTSNNNSNLFSAQPVFTGSGATRTLTFTPAPDANGSATVTVSATDDGSSPATGSQTFTITVTPVNDAPSFAIPVGTAATFGRLMAWGYNDYGQLGDNSTTSRLLPVAVTSTGVLAGKTVVSVDAGNLHSVALCSDGTVAGWGRNFFGEVGDSTTVQRNVPVAVVNTGALAGKTVVSVAAGSFHSVALCSDGTVATWGYNASGQLGNGSTVSSSVPVLVNTAGVLAGKTVVAVASGHTHCLVLCSDGTLAAWGHNGEGQLGNNSTANSSVPVLVNTAGALAGKTVVSISAGSHSVVLCSDASLVTWGDNGFGQIGDNTTTPRLVPVAVTTSGVLAGKTVVAASAAAYHTVVLCSDGTLADWGRNEFGQLGNNTTTQSPVPVAVISTGVLAGKTVVSVLGGVYTTMALCSDGSVAAWGIGSSGNLGNNSTVSSSVPVLVDTTPLAPGERITSLSRGSAASHTLALTTAVAAAPFTVTVAEDSGTYTTNNFATNILAGPANESAQVVSFITSNTASNLFSSQPVIAANGTLSFTPAVNAFGVVTVSVIAVDNGGAPGVSNSAAQTFTITITNVNDAPAIVFATNSVVVLEDAGAQSSAAFLSLSPGPFGEPGTVSLTSVANDNNALFSSQPAFTGGTLDFTPAADANGSATVTVIAEDNTGLFSTNNFTLTVLPVNDAPSLTVTNLVINVLTNSGGFSGQLGATINFGAVNETNQAPASFLITNNNNGLFTTQPSANQAGFLSFSVAPGQQGAATLYVRVQDTGGTANGGVDVSTPPVLVTVNVTPGNSAPSFTLATNALAVLEDSGSFTGGGFLSALSPGAQLFEAGQVVTVTTANNNSNLFSGQPVISGGTLTFTPAANAFGSATVTVTATDDGTPALSSSQTVTITVSPVNDVPGFNVASNLVVVVEDVGAQVVLNALTNISAGPNESAQTVSFTVLNNNSNLFALQPAMVGSSSSRNLTFTPAANASGVATVFLTAVDNGGTADSGVDTSAMQSLTIVVTAVNDAPTVSFLTNNLVVLEDAGAQTNAGFATFTTPTNEVGQIVTNVFVSNNNSNLFAVQPGVDTNGVLTFTPAANANGSAVVTVQAQDDGGGQNLSAAQTFTITVTAVNDAPVFALSTATVSLLEDAGAQTVTLFATNILGGLPADEALQNVTFVVSNDSSNKFTQLPALNGLGTLTFTLAPNANGTIVVSVVAQDNGGTANGGVNTSTPQFFGIVVTPVNDAPSVSYATNNLVVLEDSGPVGFPGFATFFLPADEAGQTVTNVAVANNNNALFAVQPSIGLDGSLTFTPAANAFGSAVVSVIATDNGGTDNGGANTSVATTFTITVTAVNDAPSFNVAVNPVGVLEDSGAATVLNAVTNISAGPGGESQSVAFLTSNSASNLFTSIGQPVIGAGGTLTFTPAANANGAALLTIRAVDTGDTLNGGTNGSAPQTLTILITNINDAPIVTFATNNLVRLEDSGAYVAPAFATFSAPADELGQVLLGYTVTTSSNSLFSVPPAIANDGTLTFVPAANAFGVATVTVVAQDNGGTDNGGVDRSTNTFLLTLTGVNDAPTLAFPFGYVYVETNSGGFHTNLAPITTTGPANESGQFIQDFITTNNQPSFFTVQPYLLPNGDLDFTLANGVSGIVTLTIRAHDSGGTNNGGVDLSAPQTFYIFVGVFNIAPSFTFGTNNVTVLEDSGAQTLAGQVANISSGDPAEIGQTVSFTTGNNNNPLFSVQPSIAANGTLTFTPAANAFGTAIVTVIATDSGLPALSTTSTFTITVTPVNDAPSFALPGPTPGSPLTLASSNFFGGAGDQGGTAIAIDSGAVYLSGIVQPAGNASTGLALRYATPPGAVPVWSRLFNSGGGGDLLGIAATGEGAYAGGASFTLTTDGVGGKEVKAIVAKFPLDGSVGPGSEGTTWLAGSGGTGSRSAFFAYGGSESFYAMTAATELGSPVIYAAGFGQPASYSAYIVAKYDAAGNLVASATDSSVGVSFGSVSIPSTGGSAASGVTVLSNRVFAVGSTSWSSEGDTGGRPVLWLYATNLTLTVRNRDTALFGGFNAAAPLGGAVYAVGQTGPSGGAVSTQDFLVQKFDVDGNRLWSVSWGGANEDVLRGVSSVGNRLFVGGYTRSMGAGGSDAVVFELDPATGSVLSTNLFGGAQDDRANGLASDGTDLYLVGESKSFSIGGNTAGQNDGILLRYTLGSSVVVTVLEDSGGQTIPAFAASISAGPANESAQVLSFIVTNNNPARFDVQPAIDASGTLTFTPGTNRNGSAVVTVYLQDNGGILNGGVDLAGPLTFTISLTPVNDPPTITFATNDVVVLEDSGAFSGSFATFATPPSNEGGQSITNVVTSNNSSNLFSVQPVVSTGGVLTFTPAANSNGVATVTVIAEDNGGTANGGVNLATNTFTITVTPVNDAPSFAIPPGTTILAGETWTARESVRGWRQVASSDDGSKLVALDYPSGKIYTSTDSGVSWTARESNRAWLGVASSADGSKLVAVDNSPGQIYTSTDGGTNWTARESSRNWYRVASSADGTKLVATVYGGQIYTSADSGVSWTPREINRNWLAVASSADGSKLVAGVNGGEIYTSTDSGVSWTPRESSRLWYAFASSADGSKLVAVINGSGQIYTSTDSGTNWVARESNRSWTGVASSADGTRLVATMDPGQIYTSIDSGVSWTARETSRSWSGIASSADGKKLVASVSGGQIYTSVEVTLPYTVTVAEDSGAYTQSSLATSILAGPADESAQIVSFVVTNDSNALFSSQPAISTAGTLTFTPAPNAIGSATVTVYAQDNGGILNGGVDTAGPQTFTITVTPVNDPPSAAFAFNPLEVMKNSAPTNIAGFATFSKGPADESSQSITNVIVSNNNTALFDLGGEPTISVAGALNFKPAAGVVGEATVTVTTMDNGGTASGGQNTGVNTFVIRVVSANIYVEATTPVAAGNTITVPVSIIADGDENGVGFTLTFDPALLTFSSISAESGLTLVANAGQAGSGLLGVVLSKPTDNTFSAGYNPMVYVTFTVATSAPATNTTVGFSSAVAFKQVTDKNANSIPYVAYTPNVVTITALAVGLEGDVTPRPTGNGSVTVSDAVQIGRFAAGLDTITTFGAGSEFQRADAAPLGTQGDGRVTVADWVQTLRFAAGLDTPGAAGGPTMQAVGLRTTALAAGSRTVRIVGGNLVAGRANTVSIQLDSQGNEAGLSLSLNFDASALSFVSATVGSGASGGSLMVNSVKAAAGKVGLVLVMPAGSTIAAGTKDIVTLTFNVSGSGATAISVTGDSPVAREVADVNANVLGASYVGGSFNIILPAGLKAAGMERAADGSLRLVVRNSDGTPVTAAQAAKYEVHVTSNLGGAWTVLPNALVLENGALKIVDSAASNSGLRLYKLVETP